MPDFTTLIQQHKLRKSPLELLTSSVLDEYGLQLYFKRDDLIDPYISGNKWRKLYFNLLEADRLEKTSILTFGGAYSNHIYAVAAAGRRFGFQTIGLIRGEQPERYSSTLQFADDCGMQLHFLSRNAYRKKNIPASIDTNSCYILPEGGSNCLGVKGCEIIVDEVREQMADKKAIDYWCTSSGTGGTASGIISGLGGESEVLVFSSLKGDFLKNDIQQLLMKCGRKDGRRKTGDLSSLDIRPVDFSNWQLMSDYHFGGYAKFKPELIEFMNQFKSETGIPLDPVYTGKMVYGIFDLAEKGFFKKGSRIVAVHTGGLQGVVGFNERYGEMLL